MHVSNVGKTSPLSGRRGLAVVLAAAAMLAFVVPNQAAGADQTVLVVSEGETPSPQYCPFPESQVYFNPIHYGSARIETVVTETPGPDVSKYFQPSSAASALGKTLSKVQPRHIGGHAQFSLTDDEKTLNQVVQDTVSIRADLAALSGAVLGKIQQLQALMEINVRQGTWQSDIQQIEKQAAQVLVGMQSTPSQKSFLDSANDINKRAAGEQSTLSQLNGDSNPGFSSTDRATYDSTMATLTAIVNETQNGGATYNNASNLQNTYASQLAAASQDSAYVLTLSPVGDSQFSGSYHAYHFIAINQLNAVNNALQTPSQAQPNSPAPTSSPSPTSNPGRYRVAFIEGMRLTDSGSPTMADVTPTPSPTPTASSDAVDTIVALVDCPSRLTVSSGIGYVGIPLNSYQLGTTIVGNKTVYQVQTQNAQAGRFVVYPGIVNYRINQESSSFGVHITAGLATTTGAVATYMAGLSFSLNRSIYLTGGIIGATYQTLNGYSVGEIVPKGTALTTTTHSAARFGAAITFPIDSSQKSPSTPSPTPKKSDQKKP